MRWAWVATSISATLQMQKTDATHVGLGCQTVELAPTNCIHVCTGFCIGVYLTLREWTYAVICVDSEPCIVFVSCRTGLRPLWHWRLTYGKAEAGPMLAALSQWTQTGL